MLKTIINRIKNFTYKILKKSEIYFKTDMVYLVGGGFWLTLGKIISILASLLSSIAFANLLPKETYGIYRYVLSTISLLTIPTLNGINTSLTRSIANGYDGSFIPALKTKIKWGILGAIASIGFAIYYYIQGNNILSLIFIISAIFLPFMDPLYLYISILNGKKLFKLSTKYSIYTRIISTTLLIVSLFITSNIFVIISIYFLSNTLLRLVYLIITVKKAQLNQNIDNTTISFGKHLSLMGVLGQISTYVDKLLIFHYMGSVTLAVYYLGLTPLKQVQNFFNSLNVLALSKLSSQGPGELKKTLPKKVLKMYIIIIPIIILYLILAPILFKILYPQYMASVQISRIFMLSLLFYPLTIFTTAITARAENKKLYISSTSYSVIRIIMLLILVPIFGIGGAVWSIIITGLIYGIITIILFYKIK